LEGGEGAPRIFKRFQHIDDPNARTLAYISEEEDAFDAIAIVPKKPIKFLGFSVFQVFGEGVPEFKAIYKYKIGATLSPEMTAEFLQSQADPKERTVDIMFEKEVPVPANTPITLMVRFIAGEDFFCATYLGYGGENYMNIKENEDQGLFEVRDTPDCTKGETAVHFGQFPRIFYLL